MGTEQLLEGSANEKDGRNTSASWEATCLQAGADWEGSEYKVQLLGALLVKLRMKLAFMVLRHVCTAAADLARLVETVAAT